jgi:hypothetical protein
MDALVNASIAIIINAIVTHFDQYCGQDLWVRTFQPSAIAFGGHTSLAPVVERRGVENTWIAGTNGIFVDLAITVIVVSITMLIKRPLAK